jgi:G:T/U-mismatch repair DNA glycosylase
MDSRIQYEYELKQDLNDEKQTFNKFVNKLWRHCGKKLLRNEPINIVVLIDTKHGEDTFSEWKGVIQVVKNFIKTNSDNNEKKIKKVRNDVTEVKSSVEKMQLAVDVAREKFMEYS